MPPFTREMARRHKKGLSAKQQRQWVAVARSAFAKCKRDGGGDGPCEAAAIRQANGVTGEPQAHARRLVVQAALTVPPRLQTLHDRDHLVADAVLLVEGVLNGAYIPGTALLPGMWDGVPIVINHPLNAEGVAISARAPEVYDQYGVGYVYRSRLGTGQRGGRAVQSLQAELWLDMDRLEALGGDALHALEMIENEMPVEVSTGFYSAAFPTPGTFADMPYTEVLFDLRPDHLALLPTTTGACCWGDGCGVPRLQDAHAPCACGSASCTCEEMTMETSAPTGWRNFVQLLRDFVAGESGEPPRPPPKPDEPPPDEDEEPEEPNPAPAESPVAATVPSATADEEEPAMANNAGVTPTIKALVNALITNERHGWSERDRTRLESFDEATLLRLEQLPQGTPTRQPATVEEAIATMPTHLREPLEAMSQEYQSRKDQAITVLKANKDCAFSDDELSTMTAQKLEKLVLMSGQELPGRYMSPTQLQNYNGRRMPQVRVLEDERDGVPEPPDTLTLVIQRQRELGLRP